MIEKNNKLTVNDLPKIIPDFKSSKIPKDKLTEKWLTDWIIDALNEDKIAIGDILPRKELIAKHLGISIGTVQNAIRYTEDKGILQSRQKTGTLIAGTKDYTFATDEVKKQNSKRDVAVSKIKKYILDNGINSVLPSALTLSKKIKVSANTVRLAYLYLCDIGFLEYSAGKSGKKMLRVVSLPEKPYEYFSTTVSLVDTTVKQLSEYITNNLSIGDKLQSRAELSKILKVSIKTVHDAVCILEEKGILLSKRGKYGTIIIKMPQEAEQFEPMKEGSIFANADDAAFYRWEKIENEIKKLIKKEFKIGMKLPSLAFLASRFNVSTNTIRRSLKKLNEQGLIDSQRGRYGGTFIIDTPNENQGTVYEWIAVNSDFIELNKN
ncbi:GntR family transcriptional regulator [bacterium]|nr:GntR family transcriptional regulator [bacterium]